jgi:FKBP-type peptidyl-prolyl cis-trans isomerase SlyD
MLKKNDFVEIDFTGRVKGNGIFDTTRKEAAKEAGLDENKCNPLKICIGQKLLINGFDNAIEGKEVGKDYTIELQPKDAFGERNPSMLRTVPTKLFQEKGINPQQGMVYSFDNTLARISSVAGGRVTIDFNNPLAGKNVIYEFKVRRMIEDMKEKVAIVLSLFLPIPNPEIRLEGKNATVVLSHNIPNQIFDIIKSKARELLDVELSLEVKKEIKAEEKMEEKGEKAKNPTEKAFGKKE